MKIHLNTWAVCVSLLLCGGLLYAAVPVAYAVTNVTIGWDANSEADIDGYGIYVNSGSAAPPFEHLGDVIIDELSDPDNPSLTLTELDDDGIYYLAATAFDSQGSESDYSQQLCVEVSGNSIRQCISASATGGGGGG